MHTDDTGTSFLGIGDAVVIRIGKRQRFGVEVVGRTVVVAVVIRRVTVMVGILIDGQDAVVVVVGIEVVGDPVAVGVDSQASRHVGLVVVLSEVCIRRNPCRGLLDEGAITLGKHGFDGVFACVDRINDVDETIAIDIGERCGMHRVDPAVSNRVGGNDVRGGEQPAADGQRNVGTGGPRHTDLVSLAVAVHVTPARLV